MDRNRNLLLVEDDETTRELLTILLSDVGWAVTAAESGEAAQAHLAESIERVSSRPAIALCDQNLPGIQGTALAAELHALCPELTLIAMSGTALSKVPEGYSAFLTKPFPVNALSELLEKQVADAPAATDSGKAVLNQAVVAQLQQTMGSRARALFEFALADASERLGTMRTAIESAHDLATYRKQAHALKGSAGMIGAEKLAALAAEAESADTISEAGTSGRQVEAMELACAEIARMLETLFPVD